MKRFMSLSCLLSVFFVLLCFFPSHSYAQEKVVTLKYSNFLFAQAQNSILAEQWMNGLEPCRESFLEVYRERRTIKGDYRGSND